jgi:hypothetical protein
MVGSAAPFSTGCPCWGVVGLLDRLQSGAKCGLVQKRVMHRRTKHPPGRSGIGRRPFCTRPFFGLTPACGEAWTLCRRRRFFRIPCQKVPNSTMGEELPKNTKTQLALAVAQGMKVTTWARTHGVPRRTAFRWAKDPQFRAVVETCRRRAIDTTIGKLARHSMRAADVLAKLSRESESDTVRLRACRGIFSDMISVTKHLGWEKRLAALEQAASERADAGSTHLGSRALAQLGHGAIRPAALAAKPNGTASE